MRLFLAATSDKKDIIDVSKCRYMLESFYYIQDWQIPYIHRCKDFLLDSGAFTFFSAGKTTNWEDYVDKYAEFVNKNNISHFFELDIDKLIGYDNVLKLRKRLETKTGKQCIPVWHKFRGKENFLSMCDEYPYVAVGGIASKEINSKEYPVFTYLINEAHKRGVKIHGLGFTSIEGMKKYSFDSVDSTSWKSGGRFGQLHCFTGSGIETMSFKSKRAKNYKEIDRNNYNEWVKFQKYAEMCL